MISESLSPRTTALVLTDVQNDFFHADGAARRNGLTLSKGRSYIESLMRLCEACRSAGVMSVATSFTLIADTRNDALRSPFLESFGIRLVRGDFQFGKWGHQVIEEVSPVDYVVTKTAPSAFFRTELDLILRHHGIETVLLAGLNGMRSVVASAYDAHALGLSSVIVSDATTDFDGEACDELLARLKGVLPVATTESLTEPLSAGATA